MLWVLSFVDFVKIVNCLDLRLFFGNLRSSSDTRNDFFLKNSDANTVCSDLYNVIVFTYCSSQPGPDGCGVGWEWGNASFGFCGGSFNCSQ